MSHRYIYITECGCDCHVVLGTLKAHIPHQLNRNPVQYRLQWRSGAAEQQRWSLLRLRALAAQGALRLRRRSRRASAAAATAAAPHGRRAKQSHEGTPQRDCWLTSWLLLKLCLIYYAPQAPSTGTLLKQPSSSERSDFPTPRGYEQAVHPPFNF